MIAEIKKPYIWFPSIASTEVAGSCHVVKWKTYSCLLDCGLAQGHDIATDYDINKKLIKSVKPHEVDYIFLGHSHNDHSGLIPALFAKNCNAHVYVPKGCVPFLKLMWADSMKIMQSDCAKLQHKHGIKATPFYNEEDIVRALDRCIEVNPLTAYQVNDYMRFAYYPAGHILHSQQLLLELKDGNVIKRIGYTSDIGNGNPQLYAEQRVPLPFCNYLIGENTYNTKGRNNSKKDRPKDIEKIKSAVEQFNKILFPAFSLMRTQQLLTILHEEGIDKQIPIYLDSPLATKICKLWDDDRWEGVMDRVTVINSVDDSKALQLSNQHCIIMSASGFLTGGRIVSHLKTALPSSNNCIIFAGYAGENGLAADIKSNVPYVSVDGTRVKNNAQIIELRSFSSHANYEELTEYYTEECRFDKLALVHGNFENKVDFSHYLQEKLALQGKSSKVICVNQDQKIFIR